MKVGSHLYKPGLTSRLITMIAFARSQKPNGLKFYLTNYVSSCCRPRSFSVVFNNSGDFDSLSAGLRRTIYRMAQEALANSARHSGANSARLCLNVSESQVDLDISDAGRGFDPSSALARSLNREHFGLQGIRGAKRC